jgi:ribosomal protein L24
MLRKGDKIELRKGMFAGQVGTVVELRATR